MASNYTGVAANAASTLSLLTGADKPTAQLFRVPLERLLDNDAAQSDLNDAHSELHNRLRATRAVQLRTLQRAGDTIDDTSESIAAINLGGDLILAVKANTNGVVYVSDGADRYSLGGALASITGAVRDVASYSGAIVAIGSGGNGNCASSNAGASWSAGGGGAVAIVAAAARARIVADPDNSRFVIAGPGSTNAYNSIDGTAWTARAMGVTTGSAGLALTPFALLALSEGANGMRVSSDGGTTWAAVVGFPANSGTFNESGCIVGDYGNSKIWHAARIAGDHIQVSYGTIIGANATWTVVANLPSSWSGFSGRPRIFCCPDTGLLVVVCAANGGARTAVFASVDSGVTWGDPLVLFPGADYPVDAFAVAGGRLFATTDAQLFAADGVGGD